MDIGKIKYILKKIGVSFPAAAPYVGSIYTQYLSQLSSEEQRRLLTEIRELTEAEYEALSKELQATKTQIVHTVNSLAKGLEQAIDSIAADINIVKRRLSVEVQVKATPCQPYSLDTISTDMNRDIEIGKLFYPRYLDASFPVLPREFYAQIISLRSVGKMASGVQIDYILDRRVQWAFWVYKGYGTVQHNRSYIDNVFSLFLSPFYDTSWAKMYFMHTEPFQLRQIEIRDRYS